MFIMMFCLAEGCSINTVVLARLENKPPMPYRVWTEKLSAVVRQWYKALADSGRDLTKVATTVIIVRMVMRLSGFTV